MANPEGIGATEQIYRAATRGDLAGLIEAEASGGDIHDSEDLAFYDAVLEGHVAVVAYLAPKMTEATRERARQYANEGVPGLEVPAPPPAVKQAIEP